MTSDAPAQRSEAGRSDVVWKSMHGSNLCCVVCCITVSADVRADCKWNYFCMCAINGMDIGMLYSGIS